MKNIIFKATILMCSVLFFCSTSCVKHQDKTLKGKINEKEVKVNKIKFDIKVEQGSGTKAVKTDFEEGDIIYLLFGGIQAVVENIPRYATITKNGEGWQGELHNLEISELSASGQTVRGIYFPHEQPKIEPVSSNGYSVNFVSQNHENPVLNGLPIFSAYLTGSAAYTLDIENDIATLSAYLKMSLPEGFVQFYIPREGNKYFSNDQYRLSVRGVTPVACSSAHSAQITETVNFEGQPMWGYVYKDGIVFTGKINSTWSSSIPHKFILFDDDGEIANPALTKTFSKSLSSGASVKLVNVDSWARAAQTPPIVELDGIKWGEWNVGATRQFDGYSCLYVAWGEIVTRDGPPDNYTTAGAFIRDKIDGNLVGNNKIYDAARAYLGSDWRMATKEEFETIGTHAHKWEMYGMRVTGTELYFTGGGWKTGSSHYNRGGNGRYWSSTRYITPVGITCGYYFGTSGPTGNYGTSSVTINYESISFGMPIRPVHI